MNFVNKKYNDIKWMLRRGIQIDRFDEDKKGSLDWVNNTDVKYRIHMSKKPD